MIRRSEMCEYNPLATVKEVMAWIGFIANADSDPRAGREITGHPPSIAFGLLYQIEGWVEKYTMS